MLSLIFFDNCAASMVLTSMKREFEFPFSMLFCFRANTMMSSRAGVATMDPSRLPVAPRFLVVESEDTMLMLGSEVMLFIT